MSRTPGQRHAANTVLRALRWSVLIQRALAGTLLAALLAMGAANAVAAEFNRDAVLTFIRDALEGDRVPGAAVAIVQSGDLMLLKGFGHDATGRPVTAETGFRPGSMSKALTALAVMRLVEAADISLDQRVVEVLPDFTLADQSTADALTLRHLLAHTSGIPERAPRATPNSSLQEHVEALADVAPVAQPGEHPCLEGQGSLGEAAGASGFRCRNHFGHRFRFANAPGHGLDVDCRDHAGHGHMDGGFGGSVGYDIDCACGRKSAQLSQGTSDSSRSGPLLIRPTYGLFFVCSGGQHDSKFDRPGLYSDWRK